MNRARRGISSVFDDWKRHFDGIASSPPRPRGNSIERGVQRSLTWRTGSAILRDKVSHLVYTSYRLSVVSSPDATSPKRPRLEDLFKKISCWDDNHDGTQARGCTSVHESVRTSDKAFFADLSVIRRTTHFKKTIKFVSRGTRKTNLYWWWVGGGGDNHPKFDF